MADLATPCDILPASGAEDDDVGAIAGSGTQPHRYRALAALVEPSLAERFDRVTLISASSASLVFRGVQRSLGREVAIKVHPTPLMLSSPSDAHEVRSHALVAGHPHIAELFDAGVTAGGHLWVSMEYAPTNLAARRDRHMIPAAELLAIARQLTDAVCAVHAAGMVHCDLKPANVLLAADGGVRLSDFGIAQQLGSVPPTLDVTRGTLVYIAPEVLEGAHPTAAADVWGLGATLWSAVHGPQRDPQGRPTTKLSAAVLDLSVGRRWTWDPPEGFEGPAAERLREVIELCLRPDPQDRPPASEVRSLLDAPGPPVPVVATAEPSRTPIALAALGVALVLLLAVWRLGESQEPEARLVVTPQDQWCDAVTATNREISGAMGEARRGIVAGGHSATAVRDSLKGLPEELAAAIAPLGRLIASEPYFAGVAPALRQSAVRDLMVAQTVTYLATGEFLDAGTTPRAQANLRTLPQDIRRSATALSSVSELSRAVCGLEVGSWQPAQIELADAVRTSIEGPDAPFFADPAAATALDAQLFDTVLHVQGDYFLELVEQHPRWLIEVITPRSGSAAVADLFAAEHPSMMRGLAAEHPELARHLLDDNRAFLHQITQDLAPNEAASYLERLEEIGGG
jgi:hypothetical protein